MAERVEASEATAASSLAERVEASEATAASSLAELVAASEDTAASSLAELVEASEDTTTRKATALDETADDDLWRELAAGQDAAALPEDAAPEEVSSTPFTISDEGTAAWAVGKINAARAVLAQREQAAAAWVEEARREVQRLETRFMPELQQWASQHLPKGKRSLKVRSGTLAFRTKPARFKLDNPEEALPWAKLYLPDAVVVKESLAVAVLFDYAKTGEVPPGVTFVPASESFTIT